MADNNSINRDNQPDVAEDDPFAELARIMNQGSSAKASAPSEAAEPVEEAAAPGEEAVTPEEPIETDPFAVDLEKELLGDLDEVDAAYAHQTAETEADAEAPVEPDYAPEDPAPEVAEDLEDYGPAEEAVEEFAAADPVSSYDETADWQAEDTGEAPVEPVDAPAEPVDAHWASANEEPTDYSEADYDGSPADAQPLTDEPAEAGEAEADTGYGDVDDSVLADVDMDFGDLDAPAASEPEPEEHAASFEETPAPAAEAEGPQPAATATDSISLEDELEMLLADDGSPAAEEPAEASQPPFDDHSPEGDDAAVDGAFPEPEQQTSIFTRANYTGGGEQDYSGQDMTAGSEPLDASEYSDTWQPDATEETDPFGALASVASETDADTQDVDAAQETPAASPDIPFEFETVDVPEPATAHEDDLPLPDLPADDFVARDPANEFEPELGYEFGAASAMPGNGEAAYSEEVRVPGADDGTVSDEDHFYAETLGHGAAAAGAHGYDGPAGYAADTLDSGLDRELEDAFAQPDAFAIPPEETPARRNGFMIAGVVLGIAVLGGIGAFALTSGGDDSATPVLVEADDEPMKVKPDDPGGSDQPPNQDSVAYDAATGVSGDEQPQQESLVTSTEEPVNIASRVVDTDRLPGVDDTQLQADGGGSGKVEDRLEATDPAPANEISDDVIAVQPRKVRTMIVKPDGTLVPREEAAPVETAAAPEPTAMEPAATTQPEETMVEPVVTAEEPEEPVVAEEPVAPAVENDDAETMATAAAATDTNEANTAVVADETPATEQAAAEPVTPPVAPVATSRPANPEPEQPRQVAQAAPVVARTEPAAPEPVATASSEWSMQIASQPSAESAQATYQELARRYGSLLDGRGVNIVRAEIAGKGTYYRVRIPMASRSDGIALCERYKAAGGSCFVSK